MAMLTFIRYASLVYVVKWHSFCLSSTT